MDALTITFAIITPAFFLTIGALIWNYNHELVDDLKEARSDLKDSNRIGQDCRDELLQVRIQLLLTNRERDALLRELGREPVVHINVAGQDLNTVSAGTESSVGKASAGRGNTQ